MPRSMACASSGAHIIGSTHATCGLTAKPPGTQRSHSTIAWYSSTHALASSGSTNEKLSAPMPFSAARRIVSRREHATHSGGWGFWTGLGTTLRGGIVRKRPSAPANGSSTIIRATIASISSHCARLVSRSTPKPSSSAPLDVSPVPNSTRPPETRSSIATVSATRAGCW